MNKIPYPKTNAIADVQKAVVKEWLDGQKAAGVIKSHDEYKQAYETAMKKIDSHVQFTSDRKESGSIRSASVNETFGEIALDLASAFRVLDGLEESAVSHNRLNRSTLGNIRLRLKSVENELLRQEKLLGRRSADDLNVETFGAGDRFETERAFYQERGGEVTPVDFQAAWQPATESVRLPAASSEDIMNGRGGIRMGRLSITKQLGSEQMSYQNPLQSIDHALDQDISTYWSESLLMDRPIEVEMGEAYHNLDFGAVVEIEAAFDQLRTLNELSLNPFAEYPMDLVAVTAFQGDDPEEKGVPLFSIPEPLILMDERTFRFPDTSVKRVRLLFNQRHYVKRDFLIEDRAREALELRVQARNGTPALRNLPELTADAVLATVHNETKRRVTKYEYQYGLYHIGFRRNEFHTTGITVSKPIEVSGNVKNFRLEATEDHPSIEGSPAFTHIEYAVHDGSRWHDLLPLGTDTVEAELLLPELVGGVHQATIRFVAKGQVDITKDGVMLGNAAVVLPDQQTIVFSEYDPSSFYAASYTPDEGAWSVDFVEAYRDFNGVIAPNREEETFAGTDANGVVQLKGHPFIDRERLNAEPGSYDPSYLENEFLPVKVTLLDSGGYRIEQPVNELQATIAIRNRTDYFGGGRVYLEAHDDHQAFYQYVVEGDKIRFNTPLSTDTRIIVEYPSLVTKLRLRAILRRNSPSHHGLTPVLEDYVTHAQILK